MDLSVLAAVGSFFVSERVLKPKATVLFLLGCVLAYDLTTKTHDVSSLRVYRGELIGDRFYVVKHAQPTTSEVVNFVMPIGLLKEICFLFV